MVSTFSLCSFNLKTKSKKEVELTNSLFPNAYWDGKLNYSVIDHPF